MVLSLFNITATLAFYTIPYISISNQAAGWNHDPDFEVKMKVGGEKNADIQIFGVQ